MIFSTYEFVFFFLPVAILGFFITARYFGARPALGFLTVASLFFYGWWNPAYLVLIGISILVNYLVAAKMAEWHLENPRRKPLLVVGILFNIGMIGYFKYANFFIDNVNAVFDSGFANPPIVLPLAISFFTFQQIAYLVDVYRDGQAERNLMRYTLFISFFPQLIAGPIVHHRELLPQIRSDHILRFNLDNFAAGLTIFIIGLFKKVYIADNLSPHVHTVFSAAENGVELSFFEAWGGVLAYTFQLYFDFSGYADMAIGAARMLNIHLPFNFFSPYKAASIIEFWRRWHMTLSHFLRDYVYIPLGGNRFGHSWRMTCVFITMVVAGIWHGAGWTYVVFGAVHGFYLVINHSWRRVIKGTAAAVIERLPGYKTFCIFVTFTLFVLSLVIFRSESLAGAAVFFDGIFAFDRMYLTEKYAEKLAMLSGVMPIVVDQDAARMLDIKCTRYIFQGMLIAFLLPNVRQMFYTWHEQKEHWYQVTWQPNLPWLVFALVLAVSALMGMTSVSEFLYFQF